MRIQTSVYNPFFLINQDWLDHLDSPALLFSFIECLDQYQKDQQRQVVIAEQSIYRIMKIYPTILYSCEVSLVHLDSCSFKFHQTLSSWLKLRFVPSVRLVVMTAVVWQSVENFYCT